MTSVHLALVLLAFCVGHAFSEPIGKCPIPDPEERTEHLPDDTDCSKFWRCNHEIPKQETCPDGLHFNRVLQVCDWPIRAGCDSNTESSQPPASPSSTSLPPRDTICEAATEDRWHIPHATDCTKFYKCDLNTGKATEFHCPDNLHFNAESQVCDWPSQAGCDSASGSSPSKPEITTSGSPSSKPEITTSGSPSSKPEITTSGSSSSKPEITTSGSSSSTPEITTSTYTSTTTSPRDPICDGATEDRWHLPHPTDCTKFYKCDLSTGKATEIQCPDDLHFNAETEVCDWPGLAGCDPASGSSSSKPEITTSGSSSSKPEITTSGSSSSTPEITTSTSTSTTTSPRDPICDSATEDRWHLPHPTDCTKFYKCDLSTGKATEIQCPDDLHFNAESEVCDWPGLAGCDPASGSSSSKPEVTTSGSSSLKPEITTSGSSSSKPEITTSGSSSSTPGITTSTSTSTTTSPRDPICDSATEDRWHLPHPTDCTKFYKCDLSTGKATEIQCPDDLHFNAESEVCDWPGLAGCDPASGSSSSKPEVTTSGSSSSKPEITTSGSSSSKPEITTSGSSSSKPEITTSGSSSSTPEITTSTSTSTTTSPRDPICDSATEDRWHLPHPTDCTKFYKCDLSTGKATEIQCPDDLHFNAESEVCDWPGLAGCDPASGSSSSKPEVTTSGSSSSKPEITTSGSSSSKPEITTSGSSSSTPGITTSTSTSTSPRDPICDSATEDRWHLPHPTDCTKFYKCDLSTGKATEIQCPDDLHFNAETEVCDWPSQAGCNSASGSSSKPEITTSGSSSSKPEITTSGSSSSKPEITTSGSSSSKPEVTTSGSSSSTPRITTSTSTSTTTSPRDPICEGATEERWHLPHPTDCAKFFKCDLITGKATEFQCPDNLHFNAQSQVCDQPSQAGCESASGSSSFRPDTTDITTSTSTSTTTSPRDPICDGATEGRRHLPHPTDCRKFYKCDLDTGKATEFKCPRNLHFNVEDQVCGRRNAARCRVDSNSSSSESGSSDESEEE